MMWQRDQFGIVSNCWKNQLEAGARLRELVAEAADRGFRFIELRQGCLGEFEDAQSRLPEPDRLATLAAEFPQLIFDLAVQLPFFSASWLGPAHGMRRILEAARALGGHLRIVDLEFSKPDSSDTSIELRAGQIDDWLKQLGDGALVSIEHAYQSWPEFERVFERLQRDRPETFKLCYDPCNLLAAGDGDLAETVTARVPADWLSMVHLKQRSNGVILPSFSAVKPVPADGPRDGIDWPVQLRLLRSKPYSGPLLFEIASSEQVWRELESGRNAVLSQASGGGLR